MAAPQPNPATIEALLDTAWRVAAVEAARTDALDRKASTLATFSSLLTSLTATLGFRFVEDADALWALLLFWAGLASLVASVALAAWALLRSEYVTLGFAYLRRLPVWDELLKTPEQVRGETMNGLVQSVARGRRMNDRTVARLGKAFVALLFGLALIAVEAALLATISFHEQGRRHPVRIRSERKPVCNSADCQRSSA